MGAGSRAGSGGSRPPQTVTSKVSTGASEILYQARPRTVTFSKNMVGFRGSNRVGEGGRRVRGVGGRQVREQVREVRGRSTYGHKVSTGASKSCTRHVREPLRFSETSCEV